MICQWDGLLTILPSWLRDPVDKQGKLSLQELRIRIGKPIQGICKNSKFQVDRIPEDQDLQFIINAASHYSPWNCSSIGNGYLTAPGGHRIGICGETVLKNGQVTGMSPMFSLCIRVARDFPGIASRAPLTESTLIIGSPGSGKTTLLRDLIRQRSEKEIVSVVDQREEIFPIYQNGYVFPTGQAVDVLSGCPKAKGIDMVLRSMGPQTIALDEITAAEDCESLLQAGWSGVNLLATAHAGNKQELYTRPLYAPIVKTGLFQNLLILQPDQTWHQERMTQ